MPEKKTKLPCQSAVDAWARLLEFQALATAEIEKRLKAAGKVPLTYYDVLYAIQQAPDGSLPLCTLAEHVILSRSGLSRTVDRMLKLGYLSVQGAEHDRRSKLARLTPKGRDALRAAWPVYGPAIQELFGEALNEQEAVRWESFLKARIQALHP